MSNEIESEFNQKIEKVLTICRDDALGDFIQSEFNSEGETYRSPWSNKYFPMTETPRYPPSELRQLEVYFNKIFKEYARLYYGEKAVSSIFVWEQGESIDNGFSCALMVKNCPGSESAYSEWDTTSLVTVKFLKEKEREQERLKAIYNITCTMMYKIKICEVEISGALTIQNEDSQYIKTHLDYESHIEKIGKLLEFTETNMRNTIDEIYIKKSNEVASIKL